MAHPTAEASQDEVAERGRVLLVDDQPEVRRVVRRNLAKGGYMVVEAWNGQTALDLARETTFDLVISDVRMPDMSGMELLTALHVHDPDLPVVLTSGSPTPPSSLEMAALGVFAYLEKPVPFERMRQTADRAIQERRASLAAKATVEPFASVQRLRVSRPVDDED